MSTLSITTTVAQDNRLKAMVGAKLSLGRDATLQEVKAYIIEVIRGELQNYETLEAIKQIIPTAFDPA